MLALGNAGLGRKDDLPGEPKEGTPNPLYPILPLYTPYIVS